MTQNSDQHLPDEIVAFPRVGRAIAGFFAGAVLGMIVEMVFFWGEPRGEGPRFPVIGFSLGAVIVAVFAVFFGGVELRGTFKALTVATLYGTVCGLILGATLYVWIMTAIATGGRDFDVPKLSTAFRHQGVIFGPPLGAILGLMAGVAIRGFDPKVDAMRRLEKELNKVSPEEERTSESSP